MSPGLDPDERPCVVVGASLAGLRAAEGLRKAGHHGPVVVFGAERHGPYNRPPLSKSFGASGIAGPEMFRIPPALSDVEWRLGQAVVAADLEARTVTTGAGQVQPWVGLIIATGLRPRWLNLPGPRQGRHVLRSIDDATYLQASVRAGSRAVVVGAGFIGCELAMSLSALGVEVHLVDPLPLPMQRQLGPLLAAAILQRLERAGVLLHLDCLPVGYEGVEVVTGVRLEDGAVVSAELVVEAVGSVPNVEWLAGNMLELSDGVLVDAELRIAERPDVLVCGDVARFPHPLRRGVAGRIEHWMMAGDTGRRAGRNLALHLAGSDPTCDFSPVPSFWSDLGDTRLQSFGMPSEGMDDVRVLEGDLGDDVAVGYHRGAVLVGVVLLGLGSRYQHYRARVVETCASMTTTARG